MWSSLATSVATAFSNHCLKGNAEDRSQKDGRDNKLCKIYIPSEGNFDVRVRKTESEFAAMKTPDKRSYQNKQNGNYNNQIGNQNKPNINQGKQQIKNREPGELKLEKGNQGNRQVEHGKFGYMHSESTWMYVKQQIKNREPGELKLEKGNQRNRQVEHGKFGYMHSESTWMYVGRLIQGPTTERELGIYLQNKFRGHNFTVEPLPLYKDAQLPCFKVRVDNSILAEFKKAEKWPNGATVKEYIENVKITCQ